MPYANPARCATEQSSHRPVGGTPPLLLGLHSLTSRFWPMQRMLVGILQFSFSTAHSRPLAASQERTAK